MLMAQNLAEVRSLKNVSFGETISIFIFWILRRHGSRPGLRVDRPHKFRGDIRAKLALTNKASWLKKLAQVRSS